MNASHHSGPPAHAARAASASAGEANPSLYREFFSALPLGVVILSFEDPEDVKTLRIVDLNPAAAQITGRKPEDLLGRTPAEFPELSKTPFSIRCQESFLAREPRNLGEIAYGDDRIRQGIYSVKIFPLAGKFLAVSFESVSDPAHADQTRSESEERFRLLIQGIQEYAIFQLDPSGRVVSWNASSERLKGYRAEEIIGKHFSVFYPQEDVRSSRPEKFLDKAREFGSSEDEGWRIRKDGSRFWANVVVTALRDSEGALRGFAKLTRDMTERRVKEKALAEANRILELSVEERTAVLAQKNQELRTEIGERKHAEELLKSSLDQLRALAARIQTVREEERTSIAREIHDELGQACTAIKMDLVLIGRKITKRQVQLRVRVNSAIELVDDMIVTLRRIASEMRPRTLDILGLLDAIECQAQEFQSRTGIQCCLTLPPQPIFLAMERSTAIFRIFQESLTNVIRHAHATRVDVLLQIESTRIIFQVRDNGRGFLASEVVTNRSLGLVGMQERAIMLNGELKVEGVPGVGTTLTLWIPLTPSTPSPQDQR